MRSLIALRALTFALVGAVLSACSSTTVVREVVEARAVNSPTISPGQPIIIQALPGYAAKCAPVVQTQQVLTAGTREVREERQIMPDSTVCQDVEKNVINEIKREAQGAQASGVASGSNLGTLGGGGLMPIPPAVSRKLASASNTCMTFSAGETGLPYDTDWCRGLGLDAPIYPKVSVRPPVPLGGYGGYAGPLGLGGFPGFYPRSFGMYPYGGYGPYGLGGWGAFFSGRF
jgi:hypothetical protein